MRVIPFNSRSHDLWNDFIENHPLSTIYHTTAWFGLLQDILGYLQKGFVLLDGDRIVGGLPLFEVKGFWGKRLVSSPFRDRGGLLVHPEVDSEPLISAAASLCCMEKYDYLLIKEEMPLGSAIIGKWCFKESMSWITTTVDLTVGIDNIWRGLKNNAQGPVKQAENFGVSTRIAESRVDMEIFYKIFIMNKKHLGIPSFSREFFMRVWEDMCQTGKAKLILAYKDETPIAGIILFLHKDKVFDAYAASLHQYRGLRPNDLLVWKAMEWAVMSGYTIFDFGADSSKQEKLLAFKKKWTGVHKHMYHYFLLNKAQKINEMDSSDVKYAMARNMLSYLPLPLFRLMSNIVVPKLG